MITTESPPAWDEELLKDPHAVADKRSRVRRMFSAIAPSYDLNNRLHSLWMDQRWRRKAVKLARLQPTDVVVDVACGTGDLCLQFSRQLTRLDSSTAARFGGREWPGRQECMPHRQTGMSAPPKMVPARRDAPQVVGVDFTFDMLTIARSKSAFGSLQSAIRYVNGDAQSLPLPDACCDVASIAFGIRNVAEPAAAIGEFFRVLRPGGRLIVLEFSLPTNPLLRGLYNFYFRQVLPRTATLISGDKTGAYKYLPESVNTFLGREQMMAMMGRAGFDQVEQFPMTFGVCVCYRGVKPPAPASP